MKYVTLLITLTLVSFTSVQAGKPAPEPSCDEGYQKECTRTAVYNKRGRIVDWDETCECVPIPPPTPTYNDDVDSFDSLDTNRWDVSDPQNTLSINYGLEFFEDTSDVTQACLTAKYQLPVGDSQFDVQGEGEVSVALRMAGSGGLDSCDSDDVYLAVDSGVEEKIRKCYLGNETILDNGPGDDMEMGINPFIYRANNMFRMGTYNLWQEIVLTEPEFQQAGSAQICFRNSATGISEALIYQYYAYWYE